ncbi:Ig-like domain-containing protein [Stenotrophomonas sp. C3(2023)]|uniref:beta strand repeat-containing protein n=1 Tax=Stenotrophomonas sp. C3(2023) TaxID=3080277 RepID=UPI00293CB997|nr:Ig-like domain-containing protein [Stenotrophomonas sp. C3(2023)]MDV3469904.1 Ig-like domain-containing protein [Stenotrophomonas sp. C3(2023)]
METASAPHSFLPQPGCLRLVRAVGVMLALLPGLALAQSYPNPLVNTATVTAPADVADPTPGNNTASDSNTLAASAQLSVLKTITSGITVVAGGTVQYRIEVRNDGPSQAVGATLVDNVPTQLTGVTWSCAAVSASTQCAVASGTGNVNVAVNVGVGEVLVVQVSGTAPATVPNTISGNAATITPPPGTTDPTPGDNTSTTPAIPVQPRELLANDDDFSATPLPPGAGGTTASVLGNDTLGGVAVLATAVTTSLTNAPAGYVIDSAGVITVPATAAAGTVVLTYQICETASPSNCDTANVTLVVSPNAVDDSYAVQAGGTLTRNVRDNDNYVIDSSFTQTGAGPTQGTLSLLGDGSFTYTANAGATGTDTFSYQVCLPGSPTVCDTATVTINITANVIDAVFDDFSTAPIAATGGTTASVLTNDTFNGAAVIPADVVATLVTQPGGYTLSGGVITVPAGALAGPVTLTYRLCLVAAPTLCDTANVLLVVAPQAVDDLVQTPGAGVAATGNVGSNDNAPAGSTFTLGTLPTQGTATVGADGAFTYTPNATATGTDTFGYQVCLPAPNQSICDSAVVTVTLGANVLMANIDLFDTPVSPATGGTTRSVLLNDTFNGGTVPAGAVTATLTAPVAGVSLDASTGVVTVAAGTPAGVTTLSYQICEVANPGNCSAPADVQLIVSPLAVADSYSAQYPTPLTGDLGANDNAPANAVFAAISQPQRGTLTVNLDGTFSYAVTAGQSGPDSFQYQVCLPAPYASICSVATASILVAANEVNAVDDVFTTPILPAGGGSTPSVLDNDTFNGQPVVAGQVSVSLVGTPPPGYTLAADGVISVPAGAAAGAVTLTYQLCEAGVSTDCDTAQVSLLVAPLAVADSYTTPAGQALAGNVGLNDNAPADAQFTLLTPPAEGSFVLAPDGTFTFTPGGTGTYTADYQVCLAAPNNGVCSTASVSLAVVSNTVEAVDDDFRSPVFAPGAGGTTPSVLGNDLFNGAAVTALQVTANLVSPPLGYSIDGNGIITVAPFAAAGAQTLVYSLCELGSTTNCDTANVAVVVSPDAVDDAVSTTLGQPVSGSVATNDNVPAGAVFSLLSPATAGTAEVNADGSFTYTSAGVPAGTASFVYQVCLPAPDTTVCDSATVTVTIGANALVAVDDDFRATVFAPGAGGTTASVLANDTYNGVTVAAGDVTVSLVNPPAGYSIDAAGLITVQPTAAAGAVTLTYQICDVLDAAVCDTATVALLVSPSAQDDSLSVTGAAAGTLDVAANDNAPVGSVFTVTVPPSKGTVTLSAAGVLEYTATPGETGADTLTYQVCLPAPDGLVCDTAQVAITIAANGITAVADDFTATPVSPIAGGSTPSVLLNDLFNGSAIVPGTTPVTASTWPPTRRRSLPRLPMWPPTPPRSLPPTPTSPPCRAM